MLKLRRFQSTTASKAKGPLIPFYNRPHQIFTHGKGCYITDSNNKTFLDFTSGIAVNSLGHSHPKIAEIIADQAGKLIHISNLYRNEYAEGLAQMIVDSLKPDPLMSGSQIFFSNSGAEANEAAFKFVRTFAKQKYPDQEKTGIISFSNAFHGRTFASLSATPNPKYQNPFLPLLPGFRSITFNSIEALDAIDETTCGVIIEPIQGEGGINISKIQFLKALRDKCTKVGALLIFDEVQCGIGRTGKLFAYQQYCLPECSQTQCKTSPKSCISPDIITMAKPIDAVANGLPLGLVVAGPHVASTLKQGDHGTTYGGGPLTTRVGQFVWKTISRPEFLKNVVEMGQLIQKNGDKLVKASPIVKEVRGIGLLKGFELRENVPASVFVDLCRENGMLVASAGNNTVRMMPPLIVTEKEINEGFVIFEKVIHQIESLLASGKKLT